MDHYTFKDISSGVQSPTQCKKSSEISLLLLFIIHPPTRPKINWRTVMQKKGSFYNYSVSLSEISVPKEAWYFLISWFPCLQWFTWYVIIYILKKVSQENYSLKCCLSSCTSKEKIVFLLLKFWLCHGASQTASFLAQGTQPSPAQPSPFSPV